MKLEYLAHMWVSTYSCIHSCALLFFWILPQSTATWNASLFPACLKVERSNIGDKTVVMVLQSCSSEEFSLTQKAMAMQREALWGCLCILHPSDISWEKLQLNQLNSVTHMQTKWNWGDALNFRLWYSAVNSISTKNRDTDFHIYIRRCIVVVGGEREKWYSEQVD